MVRFTREICHTSTTPNSESRMAGCTPSSSSARAALAGSMSTLCTSRESMLTEVSSFEDRGSIVPTYLEDEPLRHRHLKTRRMQPRGDAISGRIPLMGNQDVIWNQVCVADQMDTYYKNADGDRVPFYPMTAREFLSRCLRNLAVSCGRIIWSSARGTIYKLNFAQLAMWSRMLAIISIRADQRCAQTVSQRIRADAGARALQRAGYSGPDRVSHPHRARATIGADSREEPPHAVSLSTPSVRRRRLGRLRIPLRIQHPRLFADHGKAPHAAADSPNVRWAQLRDLQLLSPNAGLSSPGHCHPLQPLERRLR